MCERDKEKQKSERGKEGRKKEKAMEGKKSKYKKGRKHRKAFYLVDRTALKGVLNVCV